MPTRSRLFVHRLFVAAALVFSPVSQAWKDCWISKHIRKDKQTVERKSSFHPLFQLLMQYEGQISSRILLHLLQMIHFEVFINKCFENPKVQSCTVSWRAVERICKIEIPEVCDARRLSYGSTLCDLKAHACYNTDSEYVTRLVGWLAGWCKPSESCRRGRLKTIW